MKLQKCLFLDRDGIVNVDIGYAYKPENIQFMPDIFTLCQKFQHSGFIIIIVTNQSGIARDFYTESDLESLNRWMTAEFAKNHITLTDIFHCPHHPDITGECECRKPQPGMFLAAIKKYPINLEFSIMIGDKESDMEAAKKAGIPTRILISEDKIPNSVSTIKVVSLKDLLMLEPIY